METAEITVNQVPTSLSITPANATLAPGATQQFTANVIDQFGQPLPQAMNWSLLAGTGSINATGLYTAPDPTGWAIIQATCGNYSAIATAAVGQAGYKVTILGSGQNPGYYPNYMWTGPGLNVSNTNWISAASPEEAVAQTVTGSAKPPFVATSAYSFPDMLTSTPPHFIITATPLPDGARTATPLPTTTDGSGTYYTGVINMDDGYGYDWDFWWNFRVDVQQHLYALVATDHSNSSNYTTSEAGSGDLYVGERDSGDAAVDLTAVFAPAGAGNQVRWKIQRSDNTPAGSGTFSSGPKISAVVTPTDAARDFLATAWLDANNNGTLDTGEETRTVHLHVAKVDLQVDSNNDGSITTADDPIEKDTDKPGKIVQVNNGDADGDGIPDYVDGYSYAELDHGPALDPPDYETSDGVHFVPVVLQLSSSVDLDHFTFKLIYDASDPGAVFHTGTGAADDPVHYTMPIGSLRLWTRDGNVARGASDFYNVGDANLSTYGYFVPSNGENDEYTAEQWRQLCIATGGQAGNRAVTLYLEAVAPSDALGDKTITLSVDPDGTCGLIAQDVVRTTAISLQEGVDANRDQQITFDGQDSVTPTRPFRFWLNNDNDSATDDVSPTDPSFRSDSADTTIANTRDLEDFAPLDLSYSNVAMALADQVSISFTDVTGSPSIRLFSLGGSTNWMSNYLTDETAASNEVNYLTTHPARFYRIDSGDPLVISASDFTTRLGVASGGSTANIPLIWEAITAGKGKLTFTFLRQGQTIAISVVNVNLRDIAQMYDTYDVANAASTTADNTLVASTIPQTYHPVYSAYDSTSTETNSYILFVHGWRMRPWEKKYFAETAYKRLFWQGYDGRFGTFDWPTEWIDTSSYEAMAADPWNFDRSEEKAFYSAAALNGLLLHLRDQYGYSHVNVFGHSMGNIVISEALRKAGSTKIVHTYVASQAAFAANAYDATIPWQPAPNQDGTWDTPDVYSNYPGTPGQAYFATIGNAADSLVNFFNPVDFALQRWQADQITKPDFMFSYSNGTFYQALILPLLFPADTYRIFAMAAEAHSTALGATASVGGPFTSELDLQASFGFTADPEDHSAEFLSTNAARQGYWMALLDSFAPEVMP